MRLRTRIKICGITNIDDAMVCIDHGADALGFVFCEASPRNIELAHAQSIIAQLPPFVTTVALFMDASSDDVRQVLSRVQVMSLQFHGQESEAFCRQFDMPYIKAVAMGSEQNLLEQAQKYASSQALLLDSNELGKMGGSGKTFDWNRKIQQTDKPLVLAGGLSAANVAQAIKKFSPYAVDVSSGVEKSKGIKDHQLVKQFIKQVLQTDNEKSN